MAINPLTNTLFTRFSQFDSQLCQYRETSRQTRTDSVDYYNSEIAHAYKLHNNCLRNELKSVYSELLDKTQKLRSEGEETIHGIFSFGEIWNKRNLVNLFRGLNIFINKHKSADYIRQALVSMAARLQQFMSMVSRLPDRFVQNFTWDVSLKHHSTGTDLSFGENEAYCFKFAQEDFQGPTDPQRKSKSNRESDHSYSMTLTPFNLKLSKEIVIADADEAGNNEGGWVPGSFIHTISLDEAHKTKESQNQHPLILEIGIRPGFYNQHELWTKVIHKADHGINAEDIVIEDRFSNTDAFSRNLDIDFHDSFLPQGIYN